jgi:hypothetical protein
MKTGLKQSKHFDFIHARMHDSVEKSKTKKKQSLDNNYG